MFGDVVTFRTGEGHLKRHIAVTFTEIKFDYLGDFLPEYLRSIHNVKRVVGTRRAVLCVVRNAYTGVPFTGIAILHPGELKEKDDYTGRVVALKRAIMAYCAHPANKGLVPKQVYHDYRFSFIFMLSGQDTDPYHKFMDDKISNLVSGPAENAAKSNGVEGSPFSSVVKPSLTQLVGLI